MSDSVERSDVPGFRFGVIAGSVAYGVFVGGQFGYLAHGLLVAHELLGGMPALAVAIGLAVPVALMAALVAVLAVGALTEPCDGC